MFRYTLYLFAVWDICLCKKHGYDKYASKDWVKHNSEMIAEKHSHDSVSSDNIIEQYNRYRYEFIKQHDFDARTAYDSIEDKGVTILTRLDRYADDLLDEFFRNVIYAAQSSTKEELRASAQIFIIDVKAYLNLMSLCKSCHSRIHAERGDRWRKK